jgi:hypothetical protein
MMTLDPETHLAAMEKALDLPIRPEWRPQVLAHIAAIARAADLVMALDLPEDTEAAPVFESGK